MTAEDIRRALDDITAEVDPTLKHLKLASLISAGSRERGIELVVVGGSAIEFYTEGAYVSGDLDLCLISPTRLESTRSQACRSLCPQINRRRPVRSRGRGLAGGAPSCRLSGVRYTAGVNPTGQRSVA